MLHYLETAMKTIFISSLHSPLCFYDPFAWDAPYLCQPWSSDKRSFIIVWEWRTSDIQSRSRRRWSLWPLTLLWGQTDSVIWRYGHSIPYLLITVLASNCPSGLAFLIEHQSTALQRERESKTWQSLTFFTAHGGATYPVWWEDKEVQLDLGGRR